MVKITGLLSDLGHKSVNLGIIKMMQQTEM